MKGFWRRESKYVNFLFLNIFRRLSMLQVLNIKFTEILVVPSSFCYNLCIDFYYKDFLPKLWFKKTNDDTCDPHDDYLLLVLLYFEQTGTCLRLEAG